MKPMTRRLFQAGPMTRKPKNEAVYQAYKKTVKSDSCAFCKFNSKSPQQIKEFEHFRLVHNQFGYDIWEGCNVREQYMIVPKRHLLSMSEMNPAERTEYVDLVCAYESEGYSLYTRSPDNITKSVPHLHTHLLKLDKKRVGIALYVRKPHILISR